MEPPDATESSAAGVARAGDWSLPDDVQRVGNQQSLTYDSAGAWNDGRGCSGGLLEGTRRFGDHLLDAFAGISSYGGYSCRRNTGDPSQLSVHGTGRALDLMIPTDDGRADNDAGDPAANWLVTHSELVGVQYVIWDRTDWGAHRDPPKTSDYGGPNPHVDHIHMELTDEGAAMETPWFTDIDDDGVGNQRDNCPDVANAGQADTDDDGLGNRCDNCASVENDGQLDSDGDGLGNRCDNCAQERNPEQADDDGDGRGNRCDLCPNVADRHQEDTDGDDRGDACDPDDDDDGVADRDDVCPLVENPRQRDADGDGVGDACQDDDDGDGVADGEDVCPRVADPTQADADGDGLGDACADRDDDGVRDAFDTCPELPDPDQLDADGDGLGDACDDSDDRPAEPPTPDDTPGHEVPPTDDDGPAEEGLAPAVSGGCAVAAAGGAPSHSTTIMLAAIGALLALEGRRRRPTR
jgi:MYXO-CTERM domain-containing protein